MVWEHKVWELSSNADFDDLPILYKQGLFTWLTRNCLTNNKVEILKVSSIKDLLDNRG